MMELVSAAGGLAATAVFKKMAVELYKFVQEKTGEKIKQLCVEAQINTLHKRISQVRKVKTIWQVDKAVDLTDFYCDSHVAINGKRKKIRYFNDFSAKENVLVQGIAGQGKSIFMRYLCSMELSRGECIPLFLELRKVSKVHSLKDRIFAAFASLGIEADGKILNAMAESGKLLLLLDAFDEVPDELKSGVLTEIEDLASSKPSLRIVVTSRPHQNIRASSHFLTVELDNLKEDEYKIVIRKLASGQTLAETLINHIEHRATHMKEMLCTPLIVSLLVLSYKSYHQLPARLSDFYDSLFQTLLQRHDGTKPGFTRQRRCTLDDAQYREAFEALCILAKKGGQNSLTGNAINELAKNALQQCNLAASPAAYIKDIIEITCLILRDGEEHRFIHKTVQEYYTAAYVKRRPQAWAIKLYTKILNTNAFGSWVQELAFLSEIDKYRYDKFFILPAILDFLHLNESDLDRPKKDLVLLDIDSAFDGINIHFRKDNFNTFGITHSAKYFLTAPLTEHLMPHLGQLFITIGPRIAESSHATEKPSPMLLGGLTAIQLPISFVLKQEEAKHLVKLAQEECEKLFDTALEIRQSTISQENPSVLEGLV